MKILYHSRVAVLHLLFITIGFAGIPSTQAEQVTSDKNKHSITVEQQVQSTETPQPPDELKQLYALSACLMDADNGRVLFQKDGNKKLAMASTTKIMTCIIALEHGNLDDLVTISKNAAKQPDVQMNARTGEQYYLKDLLYSLMLESHNDTAVAIAEHVGGSVKGFAALMNKKASELGCQDTYFITPNGLDSTDEIGSHSTTARDLARIMAYCIKKSPKNNEFLEITRTANHSFSDINHKRSVSCRNHNAFLNMMEGALSGKTGFTGSAGYCYVGALERDGRTFIVALLACGWPNHKTYKWNDTKKLFTYGLNNYSYKTIFDGINHVKTIPVENGIEKETDSYCNGSLNLMINTSEQVTYKIQIPDTLKAPVVAETTIGQITVQINGIDYANFPIKTSKSIALRDFQYCITQILNHFLFD